MSVLLANAVATWNKQSFKKVLKNELEALPSGSLPLALATTQGGLVDDSDISVSVISSKEVEGAITVKVGVFFYEVISGCNCDDDPEAFNTRCELEVSIDKETAIATFELIDSE